MRLFPEKGNPWTLLIAALCLTFTLVESPFAEETWEEFLKLKAEDEKSEVVFKGTLSIVTKDVIIERITQPDQSGRPAQAVFSSDLILFHYGSWRIRERSHRQLLEIAAAIKDPSLSHIPVFSVEGHTCSIGSDGNNNRLSTKRAESVVRFLVERCGVSPGRLKPRGFGEGRPIASNDNPSGRRLNRRVVLKNGAAPAVRREEEPPPAPEKPFPQPAVKGRRALLVGVGDYEDDRFYLEGVSDDVKLLRDVLIEKGVFDPSEIMILTDEEATRANVIKAFQDWLVNGSAAGGTALFYFSGHGIQIWDEDGDETDDGMDEALMLGDARVRGAKTPRTHQGRTYHAYDRKSVRNFLLDDEIRALVNRLKGRTVIFISDSCHSGTVYKRLDPFLVTTKTPEQPSFYKSVFDERIRDGNAETGVPGGLNIGDDLTGGGAALAAFTASQDKQPAKIHSFGAVPRGRHSVFTWHLYHALKGRADLDNDGSVTLAELADFLETEIGRAGFDQVPQHDFQPGGLGRLKLVSGLPAAAARIERPSRITCFLKAEDGITAGEEQKARSVLSGYISAVQWTDDRTKTSCLITLGKRGNTYAARLSDSTGAYWEPHSASTLKDALDGVAGNLRAYFVQSSLLALGNPRSRSNLRLDYHVIGPAERAKGQVVYRDALSFNVRADAPGYLYILNVDTTGVIHPLYPMPGQPGRKRTPGEAVDLGSDGSFTVQEPFGREMIAAFLVKHPSEVLDSFWAKDDIGDPKSPTITDQEVFLNAIRNDLASERIPKGEWTSTTLFLRSFRK